MIMSRVLLAAVICVILFVIMYCISKLLAVLCIPMYIFAIVVVFIVPADLSQHVTQTESYTTSVVHKYTSQNETPTTMAIIIPQTSPYRFRGLKWVDSGHFIMVHNGSSEPIRFKVSESDYSGMLEGDSVSVTYEYIGDTLYNVRLGRYKCGNWINLRDSNILTQNRLLKEALSYANSY